MESTFVSIGEFARLTRLSPEALRLYDDLGLLEPAHVDAATGYRRYSLSQVEQAIFVASLRRVGLSLARVKAGASGRAGAHRPRAVRPPVGAR